MRPLMDLENGIRHWGRRWGAVLTWQDMVQFVYLVSVNPACCFHAWLHFKLSLSASASTWAWLSHLLTEWCWNLPEHRTSQLQEMGGLPVQNNKGLECLLPACRHRECWRRECWRGKGQCHIPFIKLQSQDCWSLATLVRLKNEQTMGCFWLLGNTVPVVISSRAQSTKKQTVASLSLTFLSLSLISSWGLLLPTAAAGKSEL